MRELESRREHSSPRLVNAGRELNSKCISDLLMELPYSAIGRVNLEYPRGSACLRHKLNGINIPARRQFHGDNLQVCGFNGSH